MRVLLIAAVCVAAVLAVDAEVLPPLEGMQSLSISVGTPEQLTLLKNFEDVSGFDFLRVTDSLVDVLVTADKVEYFKTLLDENDIAYTVTVENIRDAVMEEYINQQIERRLHTLVQADPGKLSFTYYPNNKEVNDYLNYIVKNYGSIASLINIGASSEGRQMKVLKLSTGGKNKPAIFIDAGIHAREWIAPVTSLYIVDQLLASQNRNLLKSVDWYILPVLNPDGYEFTHSKSANRLWRKTRSVNSGSSCRGVDGNRNYDMEWMTTGASSNPCSDTYAGPKPFSEPEMRNMRDFIAARKQNIKAYISFHSYGQYILYPWGFTSKVPSNEPELRNLASKSANAIASFRRTKYTYGTSANHLYPAAGGSDDWAMGKAGVKLSYTYELPGGNSGFQLPASEIKPVGAETFQAMKVIHDYIVSKYSS
ncbi:carboxypeptidase B [Nomia melanderi]|uniref:carboxypeptidase B n=1 Tax=Nomia melanderi TaxID=2448451 RepID=UPI003FCE5E0A